MCVYLRRRFYKLGMIVHIGGSGDQGHTLLPIEECDTSLYYVKENKTNQNSTFSLKTLEVSLELSATEVRFLGHLGSLLCNILEHVFGSF